MSHRWWKYSQHKLHYFRKCKYKFSLIPLSEALPWKETPSWNHNNSNWCEMMMAVEGAFYKHTHVRSGEKQTRYLPLSVLFLSVTPKWLLLTHAWISPFPETPFWVWYHSWLNSTLQPLPSPRKRNKPKQLDPHRENIPSPFPGEEIIKPWYELMQWKIVLPSCKAMNCCWCSAAQLGVETKTFRCGWDANLYCTLLTYNVLISAIWQSWQFCTNLRQHYDECKYWVTPLKRSRHQPGHKHAMSAAGQELSIPYASLPITKPSFAQGSK